MNRVLLTAIGLLCNLVVNAAYFQQEVNYKIQVTLNDKNHTLSGYEEIEYINNSDSTLTYLYFHLWPNAYKNNETAMAKQHIENKNVKFHFAKDDVKGYIDSLNFKINGESIRWEYDSKNMDICKLYLASPLLPKQKIVITTPFFVKIPKGVFSRLGHMGQSYQITQWYPKPAVFDHKGWHPMPYLTLGEFYSEFGSFDVSITLPANYVVGATGDLQTPAELNWLHEKAQKTASLTFEKRDKKTKYNHDVFPASDSVYKTLRYTQQNVHDFAWFADKRYYVLKGEVQLPNTNSKVTTWAMFTDAEAHLWKNSIEYLNDAIYYYSLWNGNYPYNQMTAVDGALTAGGGMEYPNVTVIGTSGNDLNLELTIMHETGHQWFYGILGSNERIHPWMDEGINTSNEIRYLEKKYPNATILGSKESSKKLESLDLNRPFTDRYYLLYLLSARAHIDQPIELPAHEYTDANYGFIVYMKTGIVFYYLRMFLGDEKYDEIMRKYFETWKFKHPYPEDLQKIIEKETGQNFSWLFQELMATSKKMDYTITKVKKQTCDASNTCYSVKVKNKGQLAAPFSLSVYSGDSLVFKRWYSWTENISKTMELLIPVNTTASKVIVNDGIPIPDVQRLNNTYTINRLFKKVEPIKIQPLFSLERGDKTQLFITPMTTWNNYDKWTAGVLLTNSFLPTRNFEYQLMPLYSFSRNRLVGMANISQTFYPSNGIFHNVRIGLQSSSFSLFEQENIPYFYQKFAPYLRFSFKKSHLRSSKKNIVQFQTYFIQETLGASIENYTYFRSTYTYQNQHILNPSNVQFVVEYKPTENSQLTYQKDFLKASLEANKKFRYNEKGSHVHLRFFGGIFLFNNANHPRYNWRMDGLMGVSGIGALMDYTYDGLFLGRSEVTGFLSQQFVETMGAFKIKTPLGQSNDWISSINTKVDMPFNKNIGLFFDAGVSSYLDVLYNGGAYIKLLRGMSEVYIPFIFSNNIKDVPSFENQKFVERIRFTLNIDFFKLYSFFKEQG